jgi:hypothetical protein
MKTIEQINKVIHEWMGECWHDWNMRKEDYAERRVHCVCSKCAEYGEFSTPSNGIIYDHRLIELSNYCSDDSPRKLLNDVLEKMDRFQIAEVYGLLLKKVKYGYVILKSAEQIARAIAEVIESET